jgi:hypothetical protein
MPLKSLSAPWRAWLASKVILALQPDARVLSEPALMFCFVSSDPK